LPEHGHKNVPQPQARRERAIAISKQTPAHVKMMPNPAGVPPDGKIENIQEEFNDKALEDDEPHIPSQKSKI
jgi:hypothetical protein